MAHLTKVTVEAAKAPASGQAFIRDDAIKGFAIRVIASGAKSYIWEGRIGGRNRRITLGRHPDLSCAQARAAALRLRAAVASGGDPFAERQKEKQEPTFGELARRYVEEHSKLHKRSWLRDQRRLGRCTAWNGWRISTITVADTAKLQQRIAEERGPVEANRVLELLRTVFNRAKRWGLCETSPVLGLERFKERPRDRFLGDQELVKLNDSLLQEGELWRAYFALLLLIGLRRSELASLRWQDVNLESGTLRLEHTKSGEPRLAPLPRAAVEVLRTLPRDSEWVFSSRSKSGHVTETHSAWSRVCQRAGLVDARLHDLRRTCASRLAMAGVGIPVVGAVLGHRRLSGATEIYARVNLDAARAALEANATSMPLTLPTPAGAAK